MINTILFDLDGTLLPMEMEEFLKAYFKELAIKMAKYIDPKNLPALIMKSTEHMISNTDSGKCNMEAFVEDFSKRVEGDINTLMPVFEDFYKNEFKNVAHAVKPSPIVKEIVENFKSKGYTLVVATNPIFPIEAIYQRLEWSGLEKADFRLITCYEKMHYCKPNPEYYREILEKINKKPQEAMMVGNDVEEDMVPAHGLGLQTFLIEDCIISRGTDLSVCTHRGRLEDLLRFSQDAPAIK